MTIKEFAKLCDCNPKTLRYYDSIDLLKPVNVDPWTGYRNYDEDQAITFVKIKNLQKAGFSIDEIKDLITKDDLAVAMAFENKIAEAEAHLQEIKNIQQSYLTEMMNIKEKILECKNTLLNSIRKYDPTEEFGISREQYEEIGRNIEDMMNKAAESAPEAMQAAFKSAPEAISTAIHSVPDAIQTSMESLSNLSAFSEAPAQPRDFRNDPAYSMIFEKHGWKNVKDFLPEFETLEPGTYGLDFILTEDKIENSVGFLNTMLSILLNKNTGKSLNLSCETAASADGLNHFRLLKKTAD